MTWLYVRYEDGCVPKSSVANVTQLVSLDREVLTERTGRLSASNRALVLAGIDTLLGRG